MIKLSKTRLPAGITIKSEEDYRTDPVFSLLVRDCHNKCYICEIKAPTSINVEHRIPHNGNPTLKYNWNNLFLSCPHCNGVKNQFHITPLDPTQIDPENHITLSWKVDLKAAVDVEKLADGQDVDDTITLVDKVYNGDSTSIKKLESNNLRKAIKEEVSKFRLIIIAYQSETDIHLKQNFRNKIAKTISRESAFAAFKRKIVWDTPHLAADFAKELM